MLHTERSEAGQQALDILLYNFLRLRIQSSSSQQRNKQHCDLSGIQAVQYCIPRQVVHFSLLVVVALVWCSRRDHFPGLAFFFLSDGPMLRKRFFQLIPNRFFESTYSVTTKISNAISDYLRAKLIEATLVGSMVMVGLALIASMPIAASSTAWAQKSNGNLALSLSLVVFSTLLSPVTTPLGLHSIGFMAEGDYAEDLHEIAENGTGAFLFISVLLPTALGVFLQFAMPEIAHKAIKKPIKDINLINLLLLNYANASIVLPQIFVNPDWDFLAAIAIITSSLCVFAFFSGSLIASLQNSSLSEKTSLMFGLGMNNNGTGLVLASLSLSDHPKIMLPIICYNLIQHIVAGLVDSKLVRIENSQ